MVQGLKIRRFSQIMIISVLSLFMLTACKGSDSGDAADGTDGSTAAGSVAANGTEDNKTTEKTSEIPGGTLPDWSEIKAKNPGAVAVIRIEGKNGDEIVTSGTDGIYIDSGNDSGFTDPLTVIYGSKGISTLGDPDVFGKHPHIYIYQEHQIIEYSVFAAMKGDDSDVLAKNNVYDYDTYCQFINNVYSSRSMEADYDTSLQKQVTKSWQTLMISDGNGSGSSFIVYATADKTYTL